MSSLVPTSYEELPYDGRAFSVTHPDSLAVAAKLRGMSPADVESSRILELGCANGGNLIPMAYSLPGSRCVGVDLSPRQIAQGQSVVDALELKNIALHALSILDIDADFGEFDYIICHGVFSWVPRIVQDKILEIFRKNLAPNGVAYVSYNTYPGWHFRGMVREMMKFHVQPLEGVEERVQHSRAFLKLLSQIWNHRDPDSPIAKILQNEMDDLENARDTYLFHEHLEAHNEPVYFHELMTRVNSHGLQYLWEPKASALARSLPEEDLKVLDFLSDDLIRQEQYFDFLRRRVFRQTMLCQQEVSLSRTPLASQFNNFQVTSRCKPTNDNSDCDSLDPVEFRSPEGIPLTTNRPLVKRMLRSLYDWYPNSVSISDLWSTWQADADRLPEKWIEDEPIRSFEDFSSELLKLFLSNVLEIHLHSYAFTTDVSDRPEASRVARHAARSSKSVTNLRHFTVELSDFDRLVLVRLDGTRTVDDLLQSLLVDVAEGLMTLEVSDSNVTSPEASKELLSQAVSSTVARLATQALLVR